MSDSRTTSAASQQAAAADQKAMTHAVAEREKKVPLKEITKLSSVFSNEDFMDRLKQAVPKQLTPNRMLRSLVGSVQRSPNLLRCGVLDVVGKMLVCASAGLETDTPLGHAHLIPFAKRSKNKEGQWVDSYVCQVIFGYHGLLDLSYRTGMLGTVNARCVWAEEEKKQNFLFEFGTQRQLRHRPMGGSHDLSPEAQAAGKADWPAYAYAHATLAKGFADPFEVMPWSDVVAIRDRAQAYIAAKRALEKGQQDKNPYIPNTWTEAPWVRHVRAMAHKTAFRQLSNWLPRSIEIAAVNAIEDAQERGNPDFGPVIDGVVFRDDGGADYLSPATELSGDGSDPGSTFGMRGEDDGDDGADSSLGDKTDTTKKPASTGTKAPVTSQGGTQGTQQTTTQQQQEPDPFEVWPADDIGEPVGEEPITTPQAFAEWFEAAAERTVNIEALRENNMDAIGEAGREPAAQRMISDAIAAAVKRLAKRDSERGDLREETEALDAMTDAEPSLIMPIPMTPGGKFNGPKYVKDAGAEIAELDSLGAIDGWEAANLPSYAASPATKLGVDKALDARRVELGGEPVPVVDKLLEQDERLADDMLEELRPMKTPAEGDRWKARMTNQTIMARWKNDPTRHRLFHLVNDAFQKLYQTA